MHSFQESFQEKALRSLEESKMSAGYIKNKKYDKFFFRLGLACIFILCMVVLYVDLKPKKESQEKSSQQIWTASTESLQYIVGQGNSILMYTPGVPKTLWINNQQWILIPARSGVLREILEINSFSAFTECDEQYIVYDPDAPHLKRTIWHEVMHAGGCMYRKKNHPFSGDTHWNSEHPDGNNHPGIYNLAAFLYNFTILNRDFIEWEQS